jgi:CRISPR-associated protein Csm5
MPYKLRILSPLHIGCGEEYNAVSYLMDRRRKPYIINKINDDILFDCLDANQKSNFVRWIESCSDFNLFYFFKNELNDKYFSLQNKIQRNSLYAIPYYGVDEKIGRNINSFIKQMNHPYVPGSEIKGAIRTAILYYILRENKDNKIFSFLKDFGMHHKREIELVKNKSNLREVNPSNSKQTLASIKKSLEKSISEISQQFQIEILNPCGNGDAKYDVMKYLTVGDSELMEANEVLAVSYLEPFKTSNPGSKKFRIYNEFMRPENTVSLTALSIESNNSRTQKMEKMGFTDCQKQIVAGMDFIQEACFRFSSELLQEEIDYFKRQSKPSLVQHLEGLASQNSKASPIFRIGKDEGFNSLTAGMAIKKMAPDLYSKVLIHATKGKSYESEFPKSRKIIQWNGKELTAGWVQLVHDDGPTLHQSNSDTINTKKPQKGTYNLDLSGLKNKFEGKGRK